MVDMNPKISGKRGGKDKRPQNGPEGQIMEGGRESKVQQGRKYDPG